MDITTFASITAPLSADQARALGGEAAWSSRRRAARLHRAAGARRPSTAATDSFPQPVQGHGLGAASARLLARAQGNTASASNAAIPS